MFRVLPRDATEEGRLAGADDGLDVTFGFVLWEFRVKRAGVGQVVLLMVVGMSVCAPEPGRAAFAKTVRSRLRRAALAKVLRTGKLCLRAVLHVNRGRSCWSSAGKW